MSEAKQRSKKRSGGKLTAQQRLRESCIIFLDENLSGCKPIQDALIAEQITFKRHYDHLPAGVPDHVWLKYVGERKWIALSKDKGHTHTALEKTQIDTHKIRYFSFSSGILSGQEMAEILTNNIAKLIRFIKKQPAPFMATINASGISLRYPKK
jgi:hypothetical protein